MHESGLVVHEMDKDGDTVLLEKYEMMMISDDDRLEMV